jgi:putative DNA primase/helicase
MGPLLPHHEEMLRSSAISDDIRDHRGYRSITDRSELAKLGFADYQCRVPGLLVPLWGVDGKNGKYAYRPDHPRAQTKPNGEAKPVKYEFPAGAQVSLDIHPDCQFLIDDPTTRLWIVEGAKKLDAGLSARSSEFACGISVSGVWNWRTKSPKGGKVVSPDLLSIALNDREVFIAFDNDPKPVTKKNVSRAVGELASYLASRDARVSIVEIPPTDGAKGALDDFLKAGGSIEELLSYAAPFSSTAKAAKSKYGSAIEVDGDLAVSDMILEKHRDDFIYSLQSGFYLWDGCRWRIDETEQTEKLVEGVARDIFRKAAEERDMDRREWLATLALRYSNAPRQSGALTIARRHVAHHIEDFDRDPYLLNCTNGVVDLRTGELRSHRREDLITKQVPVKYVRGAKASRWYEFLAQVFGSDTDPCRALELAEYVKRAIGMSFSGDQAAQCFFYLWGAGSNGKSLFQEILLAVAGDYGHKAPAQLFLNERNRSIEGNAQLVGKRFVTVAETPESRSLDEQKIKLLTGDEEVPARRLYHEEFHYKPSHHLWLASNHKLRIHGTDDGIWRRPRLIPFTVQFQDSIKFPYTKHPADLHLKQKLEGELEGILAWIVEGAMEYFATGLGEPQCVMQATAEYRREEDRLQDFIDECCERAGSVSAAALYKAYQEWAGASGERDIWSKRKFGQKLDELGIASRHTNKGNERLGIRLAA